VSTDPAAYSTLREALQGASPCQGSRGILPVRGRGEGIGGRAGGRRAQRKWGTAADRGRAAPAADGGQGGPMRARPVRQPVRRLRRHQNFVG
jgi:hypothetical protein